MFTIVDDDIFNSTEDYLCHQCNCVTKRSAHMAKSVFTRYPYADIYTGRSEPDKPGTIVVCSENKGKSLWELTAKPKKIINMLGQYYPGYPKYPDSPKDGYEMRANYFRDCLIAMTKLKGSFAFPWGIGCGAAGGDWGRYITMLKGFEEYIKGDVKIYRLPR